MLYIKSISIPEVNKFYSICFQGFNDRFYYMDTSWKRHSCPIEDVIYEAYFGARYKSGTKEAYLVDERLAKILRALAQKDFDFMMSLYSDKEISFEDGKVCFTYMEKFTNRDMQGFDLVAKTDSFPIANEHHEYIKNLRDEYIQKLQATKRDTL